MKDIWSKIFLRVIRPLRYGKESTPSQITEPSYYFLFTFKLSRFHICDISQKFFHSFLIRTRLAAKFRVCRRLYKDLSPHFNRASPTDDIQKNLTHFPYHQSIHRSENLQIHRFIAPVLHVDMALFRVSLALNLAHHISSRKFKLCDTACQLTPPSIHAHLIYSP